MPAMEACDTPHCGVLELARELLLDVDLEVVQTVEHKHLIPQSMLPPLRIPTRLLLLGDQSLTQLE